MRGAAVRWRVCLLFQFDLMRIAAPITHRDTREAKHFGQIKKGE